MRKGAEVLHGMNFCNVVYCLLETFFISRFMNKSGKLDFYGNILCLTWKQSQAVRVTGLSKKPDSSETTSPVFHEDMGIPVHVRGCGLKPHSSRETNMSSGFKKHVDLL